MVADTLRQKFIYNTPYDSNEFPLVDLDEDLDISTKNIYTINASSLYFLEEKEFESLVTNIKSTTSSVIIMNDYDFKSDNPVLKRGYLCYLMAFAFLFKQRGLKCNIINL